ncbi:MULTISPECIES: exonuclease domain-containing protein [Nocardiopsis]|uniref:Exonuclease domain-containing protein n=1 Tax=Nocardiopsis lambiniae TaxID=3075539 RepID=A0ABU2M522_9ACTN|nr:MULTISPECIES: exonuclease domain-containing protein [unclassified Nocardiopsis]MDE3721511.1 exonuclease domain-containing protein [Nocardiopsis sp. N85]MDT0327715.1 exonuclease domain-containing protein [Nocardiopsis sp. DSM 44743]
MSWHTRPMAALDFESTGLDVSTDRIVTAALWLIDPTARTKEARTWLADPGVEIPEEATAIHGITTAQAREHGRPAVQVVTEIAAALEKLGADGVPVVVYNAPYDLGLLSAELDRHGLSTGFLADLRVIDPLVLDKHTDPYRRGGRRLIDVCAHHGVSLDERQAHGAAADALAAARLAWRIGTAHEELTALDLDALHTAQVGWKAEQAASFQAYLRRGRDPEAVIDGSWPIAAG